MRATVSYNSDGTRNCQIDGKPVTEAEFDERLPAKEVIGGPPPNADSTMTWPQTNTFALACHPEQVAEMNERNRRHGIAAEYNPKGHCVISSREAHKKLVKLEGCDYRR